MGRIAPELDSAYDLTMRRGLQIAMLASLLAMVPSLDAQRGGGRMGGRGMSPGMRGGAHVGMVGGSRFGMMGRVGPGRMPPGRVFVGRGGFGHSTVLFGPRFRHHGPFFSAGFHHRHFLFPNACFGAFASPFACGLASPYISPIFWPGDYSYESQSAYDYPAGPGYAEAPGYVNADRGYASESQANAELRGAVDRLSDEVASLRQEQQAKLPQQSSASEPSTILIFRDGRQLQVQNYGVVGQTLWIFDDRHAKKVPLAEIDQKATQEANAKRGVDFLAP